MLLLTCIPVYILLGVCAAQRGPKNKNKKIIRILAKTLILIRPSLLDPSALLYIPTIRTHLQYTSTIVIVKKKKQGHNICFGVAFCVVNRAIIFVSGLLFVLFFRFVIFKKKP